jgi:hypothetical protein
MFDLDQFIKENCMMCGSQRCDPTNPIWLEGCLLYQEIIENEKKEYNKNE